MILIIIMKLAIVLILGLLGASKASGVDTVVDSNSKFDYLIMLHLFTCCSFVLFCLDN